MDTISGVNGHKPMYGYQVGISSKNQEEYGLMVAGSKLEAVGLINLEAGVVNQGFRHSICIKIIP